MSRQCPEPGCVRGEEHREPHVITPDMTLVVKAIAEIGNVVWALAKIRILEAAVQPGCARAAAELQRVSDRMVGSLKALGINTSRFEDYDTLQDAKKHPDN